METLREYEAVHSGIAAAEVRGEGGDNASATSGAPEAFLRWQRLSQEVPELDIGRRYATAEALRADPRVTVLMDEYDD